MDNSPGLNTSQIFSSPNATSSPSEAYLGNTTFNSTILNTTQDCRDFENQTCTARSGNLLLFISEISFTCFDILNVLGNSVILFLIYKATKLRDVPSRLLLNHAIADGGVGLAWLVFYGCIYTVPDTNIIQTVAVVLVIALGIFTVESAYTLAGVLLSLHLAICSPIRYKIYSKALYCSIFIATSWIVSALIWLSTFLTDNFIDFERDSNTPLYNARENVWFVALVAVLGYLVPFSTIFVCYIRISYHRRGDQNTDVASQATTRNTVRQAQGVFLVSIVFMFTFLPLLIFEFVATTPLVTSAMSKDGLFMLGTIIDFINYIYLVAKLPLFLLAFRPYRRVLLTSCCRIRSQPKQ